ncbi:hypothetical protein HKX48_005528 [Thoreauomyces humboldtii]|nr:hypothetical protein HKX48_005528 [Thoreauomyces humboldtii]
MTACNKRFMQSLLKHPWRGGAYWTEAEEKALGAARARGASIKEMAYDHRRTTAAIYQRLKVLDLAELPAVGLDDTKIGKRK